MQASVSAAGFVLVASVVAGCGAAEGGSADGSTDGGDAGGRDAGVDGGIADAGVDAGPPVDAWPPDWIEVAGLAAECPVQIARNPEGVVPPLVFEDCPQLADGCRQVRVDWKDEVAEGRYFRFHSGYHDGTHGYFSYHRGRDAGAEKFVIARDDGAIVAVMRVPLLSSHCLTSPIAISGGRFAFALVRFASSDVLLDNSVLVGRLDDPAGSLRLLATLGADSVGRNRGAHDLRVTSTHVALEVGADVYLLDDTGAIVSSTAGLSGRSVLLDDGIGDTVFVSHWASPQEILRARPGGPQPFLPIDGVSVRYMATDGEHMAWLKLIGWDGTRAERVELWASPFAEDPSDLEPALLSDAVLEPPHVGFGRVMAAAPRPGGGVDVAVYTVDGTRLGVVPLPPDTEYRGRWAVYVGPEELAIAPQPVRTAGNDAYSIQLIEYGALHE